MNSTFNWGVIAPGRIANAFAQGVEIVENTQISAVASNSIDRANQFADKYNIPTRYNNYEDLLADPSIHAVYIANPHRFHFDIAKLAIVAGKPVLCEKPLTVTAKQTQQLMQLASDNNCFLMEALWSRFLPVWTQVKKWIESDIIGDIALINSSFGMPMERNLSDRLLNKSLAGGSLLDMGIYCVSMTQFLFKQFPDSIQSDVFVGETGVDERVSATLRYGNAASQFTSNFLVETQNDFRIYGSKGTIIVEAPFWAATKAELIIPNKDSIKFELALKSSGFEYQIESVMNAVSEGQVQSIINPLQDTLTNMEVMDIILERANIEFEFSPR